MIVETCLIIRRDSNQRSQEYAKVCADSIERSNMTSEYIKAVENLNIDDAAASVGMKIDWKNAESLDNTISDHEECKEMGNACCTASHIKALRRVVEIDKPCAILEHDAYVMRNFRNFDVPDDYLVFLGPRMRDTKTYIPKSRVRRLLTIPQAIGTHAYALTPVTAKKILDHLEDVGLVYGIDHYLFMNNESKIPIVAADPYPAICWSRQSTMNDVKEEFDLPRGVWGGENDKNVVGITTPGLLEGLGCPIYV
jgi:GR25 family glycosyltransferase involved in LPS biosynthesis